MALTDKLTAIADAIREKTGKTDSMTLEQMPTEIAGISVGVDVTLIDNIDIVPNFANGNQVVAAQEGYAVKGATILKPATLIPENIAEGVEIAGVVGTHAGGGGSSADVRYVTFRNESTGEEYKKPVAYGDDCVDVVAKGLWKTPTKESTAQYNYTFYGWGASDGGAADANILKNITEDKTVYAIFTATARLYTITWLDDDGVTELPGQKQWAYGTVPSYTPTKEGVAFDKWTPTPTAVTEDASYVASWYSVIASGSVNESVTWALHANGTLVISGTGAMTDYASADVSTKVPWYSRRTSITSIVIEDGVTRIGTRAFQDCTNVTSLDIPNSVTSIGEQVVKGCSNLESIVIPGSVTAMNNYTFYQSGLVSVEIQNGVTAIPYGAFRECSKLTSVTIPNTVTSIGNYAFNTCNSLISVVIPGSVANIGEYAFSSCNYLSDVTISEGVATISAEAFYGCLSLKSIVIPASVTQIGKNAFYNNNRSLQSAEFKNPDGWAAGTTALSATDLANTTTAANYLKNTYRDVKWTRS